MSGGGARRRVLDTVDANWEREFKFLRGRVPRRSTLGEKAGVRRFVAAELAELGLDADVWEIDAAHRSATGLRARWSGRSRGVQTSAPTGSRPARAGNRGSSRTTSTSSPSRPSTGGSVTRGRGGRRRPHAACG
jgi:hypothetical protein